MLGKRDRASARGEMAREGKTLTPEASIESVRSAMGLTEHLLALLLAADADASDPPPERILLLRLPETDGCRLRVAH